MIVTIIPVLPVEEACNWCEPQKCYTASVWWGDCLLSFYTIDPSRLAPNALNEAACEVLRQVTMALEPGADGLFVVLLHSVGAHPVSQPYSRPVQHDREVAEVTSIRIGDLAKAADVTPMDALTETERSGVKLWWLPGVMGPQDWRFTERFARAVRERITVEDIETDLDAAQAEELCLRLDLVDLDFETRS